MSLICELDNLLSACESKRLNFDQAVSYLKEIITKHDAEQQRELEEMSRGFYADKTN